MEPNEMMVNEEVVETATEATEEIVKKSSGKGFKIAAGVGLAIVVGGLAVKYVIIPTANKIKAKLMYMGGLSVRQALVMGFLPFIPLDLVKAVVSAQIAPQFRRFVQEG